MNQKRMPLVEALNSYAAEKRTSFHIPAHKDGHEVEPFYKSLVGGDVFKIDASEVHGLDDLHQPSGAIKEAQDLAAELWGAEETFFLVNGTTSGIMAALTVTASEGEKILLPRNAHKAVYMSLILSGAEPVYIQPELIQDQGISGGLTPEAVEHAYQMDPDIKGVYVINPTYFGICSDIKGIVDVTHRYGGIVIVDEAHGCHMGFSDKLPMDGLSAGADATVQSTHKMIGSLTQSSMLHVQSNRLNRIKLKTMLQMLQSTSPSYVLMSSLDAARNHMASQGPSLFEALIHHRNKAQLQIKKIPGIVSLDESIIGRYGIYDFDSMRFVLSAEQLGLEGYQLYDLLYKNYNIEMEFADHAHCVAVLGPGTTAQDLEKLIDALCCISKNNSQSKSVVKRTLSIPSIPPKAMNPREAFFATRKRIPWMASKGKISAEMITPYPPGIPVLCPGEVITEEIWDFLDQQRLAGRHLHGPIDGVLDFIDIVL